MIDSASYVAAMIDGEGSVYYQLNYNSGYARSRFVSISNTDDDIINAVSDALSDLDIDHSIYWHYDRRGRKPLSYVYIMGRESLTKVAELVPIQSKRKQDKLAAALASYRDIARPQDEEIRSLYLDQKMSVNRVADHLNADPTYVKIRLRAMEIMRTRSQAASNRPRISKVVVDDGKGG